MSGPLIPYIEERVISLAFLQHVPFVGDAIDPSDPPVLHAFGMLVLLGVWAGVEISMDRCRQRNLDTRKMKQFIWFVVVAGFVISHALDAIFYHLDEVLADPLYLLMIHKGLSSFGGFIGAAVGAIAWHYRTKYSPMEFVDVTASAFPVAWVFGRAGCALVHDHPGALSNAWFAVRFPDDQLAVGFDGRYDLGLIELVYTIPLAIAVTWLWRRQPKRAIGFYLGLSFTAYAPVRFFLDFLRVTADDPLLAELGDPRYAGLTFAQWACFGALAFGLFLLKRSLGKPYVRTAPARPKRKRKRRKRKTRKRLTS